MGDPTGTGASLYDRLGGEAAIMAAVERFYEKVLADDLTAPFFAPLDMAGLTRKQIAFMTWAFGGPAQYRGRDLRSAHADLVRSQGLGDAHFHAMARHLQVTLEELGVADDLVAEAMSLVGAQRAEVLGR
jgi:hemoglobin